MAIAGILDGNAITAKNANIIFCNPTSQKVYLAGQYYANDLKYQGVYTSNDHSQVYINENIIARTMLLKFNTSLLKN